jgi:hypothetical protein
MAAFRKQAIIENSSKLALTDLPFSPGTPVEISIEEQYLPQSETGRRWREFFEELDRSPEVRRVSPEEIVAEVAAYRAGR